MAVNRSLDKLLAINNLNILKHFAVMVMDDNVIMSDVHLQGIYDGRTGMGDEALAIKLRRRMGQLTCTFVCYHTGAGKFLTRFSRFRIFVSAV